MIVKKYMQETTSRYVYLLTFILIIIYVIENSGLGILIGNYRFNYIIKPILWVLLALITYSFPSVRPKAKIKHRGNINLWAFNFASIFVIISIVVGLFDGIGRSPYDHSLSGVVHNIVFLGPKLVGIEFVRNYLVNRLTNEENYLVFLPITFFMTIIGFQLSRLTNLSEYSSIVQFAGQYFVPSFCHNLLATYLTFLGGPLTSIIYIGVLEAFNWLSPILPDLKWITMALIGTLIPIFFLTIIQNIYLIQNKRMKERDKENESPIVWLITSILSIIIVWFAVGVFPIYPSAVATGSMEPMIYPGDVILIKRNISINELEVGDVIQFRRENILISHRIIGMEKEGSAIIGFRTKGDNNSIEDKEIVKPEYVRGKIVRVVPKVGVPTIILKSKKYTNLNEIVF